MLEPRRLHTATLLKDGRRILFTSGGTEIELTTTAELYDSASETFVSTGSTSVGRWTPTASLLGDGRVLVAGDNSVATLWDPQQGKFVDLDTSSYVAESSAAGPVSSTGKILFIGGYDESRTWLYTPVAGAAGSFVAGPLLSSTRSSPTVTLLLSGLLLVAGGGVGASDSPASTAEVYNPGVGATGQFTLLNETMTTPRIGHRAVLLNSGNVLIAGGLGLKSAEIFTPGSGTMGLFSATDALATARHNHTMTLLDNGNVLVVGGGVGAEVYDSTSGKFSTPVPMRATRCEHTATKLLNGAVMVAGGWDPGVTAVEKSTEFYCP
jgi:WD40 repeat protein